MAKASVVIKLVGESQMREADKNQTEHQNTIHTILHFIPWNLCMGYGHIKNNGEHIPSENPYPGSETPYSYRSRQPTHGDDFGLSVHGESMSLSTRNLYQGMFCCGMDTHVFDFPGVRESKEFPEVFSL